MIEFTSEQTLRSESLDRVRVLLERLVDIVRIGGISSSLLLGRALVSLVKNLLSRNDVLLHHLACENVIDFDEMCRESIVEEVRWEHHVVSVEPELSTVLGVEHVLVPSLLESAPGQHHGSGPEEDVQASVVQWAIASADESGSDWSHDTIDSEDAHPHVVDHSEGTVEHVVRVLSLAHLQGLENSANETWSLGQSLVYQELKALCVS